jgi:predicted DNA binding CopG/RHH family protein
MSKVRKGHSRASNRGPVSFESLPKNKSIQFRIPAHIFEEVRNLAKREGIPYQRYIRQALERAVSQKR